MDRTGRDHDGAPRPGRWRTVVVNAVALGWLATVVFATIQLVAMGLGGTVATALMVLAGVTLTVGLVVWNRAAVPAAD